MEDRINFQYKLRGPSKSPRPGAHRSSAKGSGMEFNRLVSLQQYPDPRRLDLRASIIDPYERWLVREFKQKSSLSVFVILDLSASVRFNGFQNGSNLVAEILNSIISSVKRYGDRFGLVGFDRTLRKDWLFPATQRVGIKAEELSLRLASERGRRGHNGILDVPGWLPKEKCLLFLISDFHFSLNLLTTFLSRTISHQVVPLILEDEVEQSGYDRFGFGFLSDSETNRKKLVLLSKGFQNSLEANYIERNRRINSSCRYFNCRPLNILGKFEPKRLTDYFFGDQHT